MRANKREIGLLWRIKDLFVWAVETHKMLVIFDDTILGTLLDKDKRDTLHNLRMWGARALAIEEGKQNSDYENWGITLNNLGIVREGRKRKGVKKK
jgi:hypothetical protein